MIVQFWKRDAFSIAVELFVLLLVSHVQTLRATQNNPNLSCAALPARVGSRAGFHEESTRRNEMFVLHVPKVLSFLMLAHTYEFVQVDVFTQTPLAGNPLAIFTDARGLNDGEMQALAREMNLSETTFILARDAATEAQEGKKVRIFTVEAELPFAGHPTLGTALYLFASESNLNRSSEITLNLKAGKVPVRFTAELDKAGRER